MKVKNRALAILLSMVMVLTFMPALAFAEDEGGESEWREFEFIGGENIPEYRLYSDGEASFKLADSIELAEDQVLVVEAGIWSEEQGEDGGWDPDYKFVDGEQFSVDYESGIITFYGDKVYEKLGDEFENFSFFAGVVDEQGEWEWQGSMGCDFRVAKVEYDFEQSEDMLPGWGNGINGNSYVRLDTADHPDEESTYNITDVEVVSGEDLLGYFDYQEGDDGEHWWDYGIKDADELNGDRGTVTFKVSYEDVDGNSQSYTFDRNVVDEIYELDMRTESGSYQSLPGGTVTLVAEGARRYLDENGEEQYELVEDQDAYEWSIEDNGEVAESFAARSDSHEADLKFKTLDELNVGDDEWFDGGVDISVKLKNSKVAEGRWIRVASSYEEMYPLDMDLGTGESVTQKFEVKHFSVAGGEETIDADISLDNYDADRLSITQTADNTFTIKRLTNEGCDFSAEAEWQEETEEGSETRNESCNYWFDWEDYNFWPDDHDIELYSDATSAEGVFILEDFEDGWDNNLEFVVTAGRWDDESEEGVWTDPLQQGDDYTFSINSDGNLVVALTESFLEEERAYLESKDEGERYDNIRVQAELCIKGDPEHLLDSNADLWFHINEPDIYYSDLEDYVEILSAWNGWFYEKNPNVYVNNAEYPNGATLQYEITNVEIISQEPEAGDAVFEMEVMEDGSGWYLHTKNLGTATVRVSYIDIYGNAQTKDVVLSVTKDIYSVEISSDSGSIGLPGDQIGLKATCLHMFVNEEGECDETTEGFVFEWEKDWGNTDLYDLSVDEKDSSKVTVTLKAPEDEEDFWESFGVKAIAYEGSVSDDNCRGEADFGLTVSSEYNQIEPLEIDGLDAGTSERVKLKVVRHTMGEGAVDITDESEFRIFPEGPVTVTDESGNEVEDGKVASGNEIIITRTGNDYAAVGVCAEEAGSTDDNYNDYIYDFNNYYFEDTNGHELKHVKAAKPTSKKDGNIEYWICNECGRVYVNEGGLKMLYKGKTYVKTNPLTVKAKKVKIKYANVKKKNQTIAVSKYLTVKKAQGSLTYKLAAKDKKAGSKISVNKKTGKITVKKGLKKGTYTIKVKVTAAGNTNYIAGSKTVKVTIVVK